MHIMDIIRQRKKAREKFAKCRPTSLMPSSKFFEIYGCAQRYITMELKMSPQHVFRENLPAKTHSIGIIHETNLADVKDRSNCCQENSYLQITHTPSADGKHFSNERKHP